jgi:hypothetical protein
MKKLLLLLSISPLLSCTKLPLLGLVTYKRSVTIMTPEALRSIIGLNRPVTHYFNLVDCPWGFDSKYKRNEGNKASRVDCNKKNSLN